MNRRHVAAIVLVAAAVAAVYGKTHERQSFNQNPAMQFQFPATGDAGRQTAGQAVYAPGQGAEPVQADQDTHAYDRQAYERPVRAAAARYEQASYDAANAGVADPGPTDPRPGASRPAAFGQAAPASPDPASWTRQTGGDRSAAVNLPPSWRLSAVANGMAGVEGPNREQVVLGLQTFVAPGTPSYAPYMGPEQALQWFMRTHGTQVLRVLDRAPAGQGNGAGQSEFMTIETQTQDGTRYKALTLVMTNPMQMNIWKFYISYIAAPEPQFDAEAQAMMGIWKSWKLDGGYVQGSLNHAAQTQEQTRTMMAEHAQHNMHVFDNVNEGIDEAIRGVSTMENTDTGKRFETQIGTEQQVLRACTQRGVGCREVPTNELVQPQ